MKIEDHAQRSPISKESLIADLEKLQFHWSECPWFLASFDTLALPVEISPEESNQSLLEMLKGINGNL